ncbi:unnamed protein product [Leptosia nina]|uniref:Mariner Mos1 transposase n=1 Tax=Leptosia nina TaxID=320188 RepID=A0AAV1J9S0_9NEOP
MSKFESNVEDKYRSGRPKIYEDAEVEELLEEDSPQTQKELTLPLGVTQQAASRHLKSLRMIHKQGSWVPHEKNILLHDNAGLHVAAPVKKYLETLDWEVLPHPPYAGPCRAADGAAVHIL